MSGHLARIEKQGYLTKQGKTVRNWRKRWIILKNSHLHYFKNKDDPAPLDSIPLSDCSISFAAYCETKKRSCLKLLAPKRTWFFAAETDEDIAQWLDAIFSWGVPESHEEEDVIAAITEATHALQVIAAAVVQYSSAGAIEIFRDTCRAATQRVDMFTSSVQTLTKYNPTTKYSPTPNYNDFLKDATGSAGSVRDTFLALVTFATDARESPNDGEPRRKLANTSSVLIEKITSFKKIMYDEIKGLKPQLRSVLYGKDRAFPAGFPPPQPTATITPSTAPANIIGTIPRSSSPLQNSSTSTSPSVYLPNSPGTPHGPPSPSAGRSPRPLSQSFGKDPLSLAYRLSSTPPTDKVEKNNLYNTLLKSSVAIFQGSPNSSNQPADSPLHTRSAAHRSYSFNGLYNHLTATIPTSANSTIAQSLLDEQKQQFEDLISMSKDLAQIMKNLKTENGEGPLLPKSGHVTATMLVKAARDYANLHQDLNVRQEILAAAGRVFFATNQLYNPFNYSDEEYSTDDLLRALSQSVLALVKIVLQHHTNATSGTPPVSPTTATTAIPITSSSPLPSPTALLSPSSAPLLPSSLPSAPPTPSALPSSSSAPSLSSSVPVTPSPPVSAPSNGGDHSLLRSSSNGRIDGKKSVPPLRYATLNGRESTDAPPSLITSTEGDVNIWDEVPIEGANVVFIDDEGLSADGERPIRAGTLNQIMKRLTNENKPELRFVKAFIITYPSFTTPEVFLNKLIQRYQVPVSVIEEGTMQSSDWRQQKLLPIQLRIYNVLKLWLETRFHDFDEPLLSKLKVFMDEYMRRDGHAKLADQLSSIVARKTTPELKKTLNIPQAPTLAREMFWKKYPSEYFMGLDEEELAKQLTLVEFTTYKSIEPLELLNQAWNKPSLRKRAPNVMRMISRFNSISFWVARLILNEERLRTRSKMMTKIIRLANALYKENNLNSLLAIVAGLNNSAVHRLGFTREELSSKDAEALARFGALMSSDMGYKNYRARIHTINPPLIPYLGIYLTDLTFIEDGNPDMSGEGLINFKKREMIFNVISEIQQYQQEPYKYEGIDQLIGYLAELPIIEDTKAMDKELYDLSLQREPRNSQKSDIV